MRLYKKKNISPNILHYQSKKSRLKSRRDFLFQDVSMFVYFQGNINASLQLCIMNYELFQISIQPVVESSLPQDSVLCL